MPKLLWYNYKNGALKHNMKNVYLLICLLLGLALPAFSQVDSEVFSAPEETHRNRTVIGFGPASFWSPTIKFEQGIGDWVSLGFHGKGRFILWNGGKVEPFVRVYFTQKSPEGPFIQAKGSFGAYKRNFVYDDCYYDANGNYVCYTDSEDFFYSFGGGLAGGYQFFFGARDHFALDLFGGFQYMYQDNNTYSDYRFLRKVFINFPVDIGVRLGVAF